MKITLKTGRLLISECKLYVPLRFLSLFVFLSEWPDFTAIWIRRVSETVCNKFNARLDLSTFVLVMTKRQSSVWSTSTNELKLLRDTQKPNFSIPVLSSILIFWDALFLGLSFIWANNSDCFFFYLINCRAYLIL